MTEVSSRLPSLGLEQRWWEGQERRGRRRLDLEVCKTNIILDKLKYKGIM